jgi:hypothetical protein
MKRLVLFTIVALSCIAASASAAAAALEPENYSLESVSVALSDTQAGAHPDFTTDVVLSSDNGIAYAKTKDVTVRLPAGLFGNPAAFPKCTTLQLATTPTESHCPLASQVGSSDVLVSGTFKGEYRHEPVYNMPAPGGDIAARFGFYAAFWPVYIDVRLDPDTHTLIASVQNASSAADLVEASTRFWGVPNDPVHNPERITPVEVANHQGPPGGRPPASENQVPFMTNPTSCGEERAVTVTVTSYQLPGRSFTKTAPFPAITGCGLVDFKPSTALKPTTTQGTSGSGLDYELTQPAKGLEFANLTFDSELRRAEVTLPEGMTINPSEAEGLGVCSEADLARETYDSGPNVGCPETSKVGTVEAISPVIDRNATGSLFLARPYQNPFGSLLALYMVLKVPDRGVLVKLAGRVTTDPQSGQITTVFDDIPQLPVAEFHLHFREGARAPLITPPACGTYSATSDLSPWSNPAAPLRISNSFSIESGPDHGPCPSGGLPPFHPGLLAGTLNNAAGTYSPFNVELTRTDAEQEITHFSIKLPPGVVGRLAGIPFCPEGGIARAAARTGPHGGEEELTDPSCPAASRVGTSWAGSGVGNVLVYVPGSLYLAGPYHGSPLSIVSVTAAKAGPFDLGTVVVREALRVNPETAEIYADATGSDPIPHIINGIPVHLREIRVYVDRPGFVLNPTNCEPTSTASTVLGSGLDFSSEADDNPLVVSSRFQAADCAALPFKPKLSFRLRGSHRRAGNPSLRAHLEMNGIGEAAIRYAQVTLPRSEFLAQAHIGTVCTRVQFNAGAGNGAACPAASIYGHVKATTPILEGPLEGPIFLRSSEHELPDLVAALHHQEINVDLVGRIDSVKGGGIRNTFEFVPDAPVTSADFTFFGKGRGLLENSTNLCVGRHRVKVLLKGHNGKRVSYRTPLKASCGKKRKPAA